MRRCRYFSAFPNFLSASVVSRYVGLFWGAWRCVPKIAPRGKSIKKKGCWTNGTNRTDPNTQTKPPRKRCQPGPTPDNETTAEAIPAGILFLLDRFGTIPPRLSYPLSYWAGGYPIGYTNRADCRCGRNAIAGHIPHFTPTTSDVITAKGVTQFLALYFSL